MIIEERRKFERFNINVPVRIEIVSQEGRQEKYDLETSNLSAEGIYIAFERQLTQGSQIKIEIFLNFEELKTLTDPSGTLIIATNGRVIRYGPEGMALRFDEDYDLMASLDLLQKEK